MGKSRKLLNFSTNEIALVSVFSAVWIVSQIYLGPVIGQITHVHGVINRLVGWLLMLILAELTQKFGRVSIMAAIAALVTRIIRRSASLYALTIGMGYALAGLTFDILFFLLLTKNLEGRFRNASLLGCSIVSGLLALVPYLIFKFSVLGLYGFVALSPVYAYSLAKGTLLSFLGTFIGLPFLPRVETWKLQRRS